MGGNKGEGCKFESSTNQLQQKQKVGGLKLSAIPITWNQDGIKWQREKAKCHGMQKSFYHIIEKQSDMERRHGSPHIVRSLFFLQNFQSSLSPSPMRSFGQRVMVMAGGKEISGCWDRKMSVDGMMQTKSISYTIYWSVLVHGGDVPQEKKWIMVWYKVHLKRGAVSDSPLLSCSEVKTVNL